MGKIIKWCLMMVVVKFVPDGEIFYTHYAKIKGLTSGYKYAQMLADKMRPEGGAGEAANRYGSNSGAF